MKKMKIRFALSLCLLLSGTYSGFASATDDPVIIQIEDMQISLSEFEEIYRKSNVESVVADPKSPEEYLEMYIDFRLKVLAARDKGLDTNTTFINELHGYRQQLAKQYLVDNEVTDKLLHEAYERSLYDIRAAHILLSIGEHAPPEDTLETYNRLLEIRNRALRGESFADLARQYSDDPSARDTEATAMQPARKGNAGDLGYFTVFNMVYPFESGAYNTPVGEISMPVRTSFGFHLIKVKDRLPAMGTAKVAHIMRMTPQTMSEEEIQEQENKIIELYELLNQGADFGELAQEHSEDRQSAQNQGEMPPFASNRMVPQFIKAISKLEQPGNISDPVRTDFGWHIVKLIEKNPPKPFEEVDGDLRNRIQRDARSQLGQELVIERLKHEYKLEKNTEALRAFYAVIDDSVFTGQWVRSKADALNDKLFSFANKIYSQADFADYINETQRRQNPMEISHFVNKVFNRFVNQQILDYEDSRLEIKYPEFRSIMQEYHDGILLFEITDQKVWSKATADTTALRSFFDSYADKYQWKGFNENRGAIIAEYQNYLEKNWVTDLRKRYSIHVNRDLLLLISNE